LWLGTWLQASSPASAVGSAGWPWGLAAVAGGAVALVGWRRGRRAAAVGVLAWDGEGWLLEGEPVSARLKLATSAGLLVLLTGRLGRRWIGISRAEAGPAWHGLRVALQAHARGTAIPEAPAAASTVPTDGPVVAPQGRAAARSR
jgi:hypothetical protein